MQRRKLSDSRRKFKGSASSKMMVLTRYLQFHIYKQAFSPSFLSFFLGSFPIFQVNSSCSISIFLRCRDLPIRLGNMVFLSWIQIQKLGSFYLLVSITFLIVSEEDLPAYNLFDVLPLLGLLGYSQKSELKSKRLNCIVLLDSYRTDLFV